MNKKISIILSTYNEKDTIQLTINEIFSKLENVEVVVVESDSRLLEDDKVYRITKFLLSKSLTKDSAIAIEHSTVYINLSFHVRSVDVNAWAEFAKSQVSTSLAETMNI